MKHPVGHGLNFMANYAYSHAFTNRYLGDYFSSDSALADFYTLRDPHLNHVPSPYDLRHTFNALLTYDLPFGPGKAFSTENSLVNKVIGGWTVGSIFSWQIGRNFKLAGGQDTYNWFDTYNVNNGLDTHQTRTIRAWFSTASPFRSCRTRLVSILAHGRDGGFDPSDPVISDVPDE